MKCKVNHALQGLLDKHRIYTNNKDEARWNIGEIIYVNDESIIEPYSHIFAGYTVPRRLGSFSYSFSRFVSGMSVGRYTSISWDVSMMGSKHPVEWASTAPFSYSPQSLVGIGGYFRDTNIDPPPPFDFPQDSERMDIGHDVWIGAGALLNRDISIGTGAVIGARSIVTKDVPAYAIVAGSPARVIRYRFSEDIIERLLALEWWNYGPEILHALDIRDPQGFIGRMEDRVGGGIAPLELKPLSAADIRAAYPPTAAKS